MATGELVADLYRSLCYGQRNNEKLQHLKLFFNTFMQCVDQGCMDVPQFDDTDTCTYIQRCLGWLTTFDPQAKRGFEMLSNSNLQQNTDALLQLGISPDELTIASSSVDPHYIAELVMRLARQRGYTSQGLTLFGVLGALFISQSKPLQHLLPSVSHNDIVIPTGIREPSHVVLNNMTGRFHDDTRELEIPGKITHQVNMYEGDFIVRIQNSYFLFNSGRSGQPIGLFQPFGMSFDICVASNAQLSYIIDDSIFINDQEFQLNQLPTTNQVQEGSIGIVRGSSVYLLELVASGDGSSDLPSDSDAARILDSLSYVKHYAIQRGINIGDISTL